MGIIVLGVSVSGFLEGLDVVVVVSGSGVDAVDDVVVLVVTAGCAQLQQSVSKHLETGK